MRSYLSLWAPVVLYMIMIFALSAQHSLPQPPGPFNDKSVHAITYGGLGALALRAFAGGRWIGVTPGATVSAAALATLYGVVDEWHQSYVPGRESSVADAVADTLGASLAVAALYAWVIIARTSSKTHELRAPDHRT